MDEKDRWSFHVEYLKVAIALSTALIAAGAGIYVDAAKIPTDWSRYVFLAAACTIFLTLIFSVWSIAALSNRLVHVKAPAGAATVPGTATPVAATTAPDLPTTATVTTPPAKPDPSIKAAIILANASFLSLIASVGVLALFFGVRTFLVSGTSYDRAVAGANAAAAKLLDEKKGETVNLKSIEFRGDIYVLTFQVVPTSENITVQMDAAGSVVKSAKR